MPEPGPPAGADGVLRPVLELAFDLARVGARSLPPIEPPRAVRPFLNFKGKLPDGALAALRRGIDEDEDFRNRIAGLADESELGRAGWLLVVRPDGWEEDLEKILDEADAKARAAQEEKEERSARRKLTHAEEARERAEAAAARARAELAAATNELVSERRARRAAQEEASQLGRRAGSLEGERDSARRRAADSGTESARLQVELESAQGEVARLGTALEAAEAEMAAQALKARAEQLRAGAEGGPRAAPVGSHADGSPSGTAAGGPALGEVARAVAAAAAAASTLGQALADASAALAPAAAPAPSQPRGERRPPPAAPRRRPARLPPAVFDDTDAAAAHLVRLPGALVLVDGYNAAKALWPELAPPELRARLDDALSELVARTGAAVHVVYDGDEVVLPRSRPTTNRGVRVSFSPPGVEADDVILDLVDAEPPTRAVVVSSSDGRVRDGAIRRGANVISTPQLAGVLRRG